MQQTTTSNLAIASSAGGFKGVFVHGVLSALEAAGIHAEAYAATSSSVFPSISAAVGQANDPQLASEVGKIIGRELRAVKHRRGLGPGARCGHQSPLSRVL